MQQQPRPELGQRRRVKATVIDRQPERDLPAQIPRDASIACSSDTPQRYCNNNTFASSDGGIDGRPTPSE